MRRVLYSRSFSEGKEYISINIEFIIVRSSIQYSISKSSTFSSKEILEEKTIEFTGLELIEIFSRGNKFFKEVQEKMKKESEEIEEKIVDLLHQVSEKWIRIN